MHCQVESETESESHSSTAQIGPASGPGPAISYESDCFTASGQGATRRPFMSKEGKRRWDGYAWLNYNKLDGTKIQLRRAQDHQDRLFQTQYFTTCSVDPQGHLSFESITTNDVDQTTNNQQQQQQQLIDEINKRQTRKVD